jgi:type I restriction enzyme, S subunit
MESKSKNAPALRFSGFDEPWVDVSLGEIGSFKNGINKAAGEFGFGYPFVNLMDVFGKPALSTQEFGLVNSSAKERETFDLRKGDVLFIRSSVKREGVGETAVVLNDLKDTVYSGFLIRFRDRARVLDLNFKRYCFHTRSFRNNLLSVSTSSANTNINQESLSDLFLSLPSLAEQQKISAFLSAVDEKIGQLARKEEFLRKYKKGVMQQIFDQTIRFKDDNGSDFPDWEDIPFRDIARLRKEKFDASTGESRKCVELEHLDQGTGKLLGTIDSAIQKSIKNVFSKDDILFGKLRPYLKKYWHAAFDGVCSTEIWVMSPSPGYLGSFLFYLIQSAAFLQAVNISSGSKMPRAEWDIVSKYIFSFPTDEREQSRISDFLSHLDQKIELVNLQLDLTKYFKKGLLQQMFV